VWEFLLHEGQDFGKGDNFVRVFHGGGKKESLKRRKKKRGFEIAEDQCLRDADLQSWGGRQGVLGGEGGVSLGLGEGSWFLRTGKKKIA